MTLYQWATAILFWNGNKSENITCSPGNPQKSLAGAKRLDAVLIRSDAGASVAWRLAINFLPRPPSPQNTDTGLWYR